MKKNYKILLILIGLCIAGIMTITSNNKGVSVTTNNEVYIPDKTKEKPAQMQSQEPKHSVNILPTKITIQGIEAPIYPVGLTEKGAMDTVDGAEAIGWYEYGAIPGKKGNALLEGHRDWGGKLGTFHNLENLKLGTEITIQFSDGSKKILTLQKTEILNKDHVPTDVMRVDGEERTTLITCGGKFIKKEGTYQNRVFSIFKSKKDSDIND